MSPADEFAVSSSNSGSLQSPVSHLLRTNTAPSDHESNIISQFILELQSKLVSSSLQKRNQDVLSKHIRIHQALLSPVRRLPPELIELIFSEYDGHTGDHHTLCWKDLPWSLSHVSQKWRQIALSLSTLWNHIPAISGERRERTRRERMKAEEPRVKVAELLSRSKNSPLTFSYRGPPLIEIVHVADPVLDLLIANSKRWHTAYLAAGIRVLTHAGFEEVKGRIPLLKCLTLELGLSGMKMDTFVDAPSLREVFLIDTYACDIGLPWSQLTFFKETTKYGRSLVDPDLPYNPSTFRSLKCLELARYGTFAPWVSPQTIMPQLTILRVRTNSSAGEFSNFTLPALEELSILHYPGDPIPLLIRLVERSNLQQSLKTLCIGANVYPAPGKLKHLLQSTPAVTRLDINLYPFSPLNLRHLVPVHNQPVLLPHLKHLKLIPNTMSSSLEPYFGVIADLVQTRCECKTLEIDNTSPSHMEKFERLDTFRIAFDHLWKSASRDCQVYQGRLNGWPEEQRIDATQRRILTHLEKWSKQLFDYIPAIACPGTRKDIALINPIHQIFKQIEAHEFKDVRDIYHSNLYVYMYRITQVCADELPRTARLKLRAEALWKKWEPLLMEDEGNGRWVTFTPSQPKELQYLPHGEVEKIRSPEDVSYFDKYARLGQISPKLNHEDGYVPQTEEIKYLFRGTST